MLEIKMSEGLPIPFLGYLNLPFLKDFRYTMCFKLKKRLKIYVLLNQMINVRIIWNI